MLHLEERLATLEGDLAPVLVIEVGQFAVEVELDRTAVAQLHGLGVIAGAEVLVVVG
ncbi:hypothetical protein D3C76_1388150 [compost metagenome]